MVDLLEANSPEFAHVYTSSACTPSLVWDQDMRAYLRRDMHEVCAIHKVTVIYSIQEIRGILTALSTVGGSVDFVFTPITPVYYPQLEAFYTLGNYYVDNLVDQKKFPDWPINDVDGLLQQACNAVKGYDTMCHIERYCEGVKTCTFTI